MVFFNVKSDAAGAVREGVIAHFLTSESGLNEIKLTQIPQTQFIRGPDQPEWTGRSGFRIHSLKLPT